MSSRSLDESALLTWVGDASALYYDVKISEVGSSNRRTYRVTEPCYINST